jgi:hypothetical protein
VPVKPSASSAPGSASTVLVLPTPVGPSRVALGQLGDRNAHDALESCVLSVDDAGEFVRERRRGQPALRQHGSIDSELGRGWQCERVLGAPRNRVDIRGSGARQLVPQFGRRVLPAVVGRREPERGREGPCPEPAEIVGRGEDARPRLEQDTSRKSSPLQGPAATRTIIAPVGPSERRTSPERSRHTGGIRRACVRPGRSGPARRAGRTSVAARLRSGACSSSAMACGRRNGRL